MKLFRNTPSLCEKTVRVTLVFLWAVMVLISVNHIFPFTDLLQLSTSRLGVLSWAVFLSSVLFLAHNHWKSLTAVFTLFFILGYMAGPFLEPPADPLDHLRNSYGACNRRADEINRVNKGLWQYSMVGNFICHDDDEKITSQKILHRIDLANGMFWAMAATVLYVVGLRAGLRPSWSFFSLSIAFLFMGTNRFSYFSYYSFAPSFSSIWIFWLWIAAFFFERDVRSHVTGTLAACCSLPILVVNHIQEAIFVALVCGIWIFLFFICKIKGYFSGAVSAWRRVGWWGFIAVLIAVFFVLPQYRWFQTALSHLFPHNYWQANQEAVFIWQGFHAVGKIWSYRINDTLAFMGFLPLLLAPLFIHPGFIENDEGKKWQVLVLGLLPLLVYGVPLLNYIWLSNCVHLPTHIRYYYRMAYSSLFWLPLALVFQVLYQKLNGKISINNKNLRRWSESFFLTFCLVAFAVLSLVNSSPIYGKMDFILVDSKRWWDAWRPMIDQVLSWEKDRLDTDYTTGYVLHAVFDVPLKYNQFNILSVAKAPKRDIRKMAADCKDARIGCLVNLHAFTPTWVPFVTGHWDPALSQPSLLYTMDGVTGDALQKYLQDKNIGCCYVYY